MKSSKPGKVRKKMFNASHHVKSGMVKSMLSEDLKADHKIKSVRVRKGDSVKIMRGEYSGVEAKVSGVHVGSGKINVDGVKKQKIAGGDAQVGIHASNVKITRLNLDDDWRKKRIGPKE